MTERYFCKNQRRRSAVRHVSEGEEPQFNGIDYLEVLSDDQTHLGLYFIHPVPRKEVEGVSVLALGPENFLLEGGIRVQNLRVESVVAMANHPNGLELTVNQAGDFSTYRLRIVTSATNDALPSGLEPHLDSQLAAIDFSFKVHCPNPFDCPQPAECPPENLPAPQIDYLAKDYASFRQLMLDRMAVTLPTWKERNPADIGIALVETLAYAADYLSYYQDAAATEAYLGTARQRASVRRHTRLLGYSLHEGCNSRTWVQVQTSEVRIVKAKDPFLTRVAGLGPVVEPGTPAYRAALNQATPFEALHDQSLFPSHGKICFYTWCDDNCCLPRGATQATLLSGKGDAELHLQVGDVLVLEEIISPETGRPEDADLSHRHPVRLCRVGETETDPLTEKQVVEVEWHPEDALTFPLCLSKTIDDRLIEDLAVARGNLVLADHGLTEQDSPEQPVLHPASVQDPQRHRPRLSFSPLTQRVPYQVTNTLVQSAQATLQQDPRQALGEITLSADGETWEVRRDLLNSDRFERGFVVEVDNNRTAQLRFGDGVFGRRPGLGTQFVVTYRLGSGQAGNVGAEAIAHMVTTDGSGIEQIRNPLPAVGGTEPEAVMTAKLDAPQAFRVQQRAVTAADYAEVAQRHPQVQRAQATRRWTGSWYTWFLTVDRRGGLPIDARFEAELRQFLESFRLAGYDLEIDAPQFVPLDIAFSVCVQPGYYSRAVEAALLDAFSNHTQPDGQRGFFHPDNFTFGQSVYLSQMVAIAMAVPGVRWVDVNPDNNPEHRFQRWGRSANNELENGEITMTRLEIAQLDNDPNAPENGQLQFFMEGGR